MDIVKTLNCNRAITDLDSLTTNLVESCVKDTEENYQRFWRHKLEDSSKLTFYTSIKEDYELETYLTTITNSNQGKRLTQLRLSNHKLMIELDRYDICKICQAGEIEREHHFLTSCEAYSSLREKFEMICSNTYNFSQRPSLCGTARQQTDNNDQNDVLQYWHQLLNLLLLQTSPWSSGLPQM
ncbi:Hypothetical predicted protein, partial [Paramuricea clavata]